MMMIDCKESVKIFLFIVLHAQYVAFGKNDIVILKSLHPAIKIVHNTEENSRRKKQM